jgi:hypothetical protein
MRFFCVFPWQGDMPENAAALLLKSLYKHSIDKTQLFTLESRVFKITLPVKPNYSRVNPAS